MTVKNGGHGLNLYGLCTALSEMDGRVNPRTTYDLWLVMARADPIGFDRQVRYVIGQLS